MVLSNLNNNMDVESRTMATMGDTLGGSVDGGMRGPGRLCAGSVAGPDSVPWHHRHFLFTIFGLGRAR